MGRRRGARAGTLTAPGPPDGAPAAPDAPPSPHAVAVTVARLDRSSAWRRFTVDASGPAWVRLDERLADPAACDAWYAAELRGTAAGHADLAGALIVYRLAGALAELVVGPLRDQGRCVDLSPAALSLRLGPEARLDEVSVRSAAVAVLASDDAAGAAGVRVVSPGRLVDDAAAGLVAVFSPLVEVVRARAPFGRRGMWGTLADHVAEVAVRRAREARGDVDAAWDAASALVDALADREPMLRVRPRRQLVDVGAGTGGAAGVARLAGTAGRRATVVAKGTCCLVYKAAGPGAAGRTLIDAAACTACPLRSEEDRARRFAAHLASSASGGRPG